MRRTRTTVGLALTASLGVALTSALGGSPASAKPNDTLPDKLVKEVRTAAVADHLRAFQRIADASGNADRAAGSSGYDSSLDYVKAKLDAVGYVTEVQEFPFVYTEELKESFRQLSPTARDIPVDVMTYSGASPEGGTTAALVAVPATDTTPGCEAADFTGRVAGAVVLVPRGACSFLVKAQNAEAAGAVGVVVSNNDAAQPDLLVNGTLGTPDAVDIPAGGTSLNEGNALRATLAAGPVQVNLDLAELTEDRVTTNLIAEWPYGDPEKVVMAGSHLDSVPEGPGINDNGTGSAGVLETALQLAAKGGTKVPHRVRFGWWGAEEFGLVGSTAYVDSLSAAERDKIALYLNFDMIGSPNYIFGIYDGDNSDAVGAGAGPAGSAQIEKVLERYFDTRGQDHVGTDFSGRSDYQAFINNGIPAGGLFTGAETQKTADQAALFGGVAGAALDPCYHQGCDSLTPVADGADADLYAQLDQGYDLLGNVNVFALGHNADAIAYSVGTFALSLDELSTPVGLRSAAVAPTQNGITGVHTDHGDGAEHHDPADVLR
ncbi:M28 family peptidase [Nocardioides sp.]|uniref:M28 family peptidase n=1 Tax=Nocardioides sp. TaxID=35761 RepID=UPI00286C869C|nr:M28 family peptidase [Nocardioides sp.]